MVVAVFDPSAHSPFCFGFDGPDTAVVELGFQGREERLGQGVEAPSP